MTDTKTACPDCGKDVAVNKDGAPRKHQCQPTPEPVIELQPDTVPETQNEPVTRSGRCYVTRCPRPELNDGVGLCGAHYALRPELRKVARHG